MEGHYGNHTDQGSHLENSSYKVELGNSVSAFQCHSQQERGSFKKKSNRKLKLITEERDLKVRWNTEENFFLIELYKVFGANWSVIAGFFNDRSTFSVKNHFYSLKKRMSLTEKMNLIQELTHKKERRFQLISDELSINHWEREDDEAIVDSFFASYLNSNSSQKINDKCLTIKPCESNMDGQEEKNQKEKLCMLKKFSKIIEKQLALKKAKFQEI